MQEKTLSGLLKLKKSSRGGAFSEKVHFKKKTLMVKVKVDATPAQP